MQGVPAFPSLPDTPFHVSDRELAAAHVRAIGRWREDVVAFLRRGELHVAPDLVAIVEELFGLRASGRYRGQPYALAPFPSAELEREDAVGALRELLLWRAGVVDFALDAWDSITGGFALEDCRAIERLLEPPRFEPRERCPLCLGRYASVDASRRHFEECPVQLLRMTRPR